MGITPPDFWGDVYDICSGWTLRELEAYAIGCGKTKEKEMEIVAWHAANLMNCWVKKPLSVDKLLGKKSPSADALPVVESTVKPGESRFDAMRRRAKELEVHVPDEDLVSNFLSGD